MNGNFFCSPSPLFIRLKHLFVYGTLMLRHLFDQIVDGKYASTSGYLDGFQRFKVIGEVYPALVGSQTGDRVHGLAYLDVSPKDLERLDAFEGDMYKRISTEMVTELGEVLPVDTYICGPNYLNRVSNDPWDFSDFDSTAQNTFLSNFPGWETN